MENINRENQLIVKYLKQQLSEEESGWVAEWLQQDKANQDFLFSLEELYWANQMEEMQQLADTNREWKKLEKQILRIRGNRFPAILKYAAVIVIAISLPFVLHRAGFFYQTDKQEVNHFVTMMTGKGERSQLILPDGTKVWINACSSLVYNTNLSADRQLKLSGEAYFEVTKDEHHPFIVSTPLLDIKVLGTKFNLRAFEEENEVRTTLYEGSVSANTPDRLFKQDFILQPGEQLIYGKNNSLLVVSAFGKEDKDWKDGIFHFKKQTLRSITYSMERIFNVEITITDPNLSREEFTCEFKDAESLTDMLNILKMTKKLDYSVKGQKVTIVPKNKIQ
jgi:ferric-dicitrate binding protein FerR (iron transport regulator)